MATIRFNNEVKTVKYKKADGSFEAPITFESEVNGKSITIVAGCKDWNYYITVDKVNYSKL